MLLSRTELQLQIEGDRRWQALGQEEPGALVEREYGGSRHGRRRRGFSGFAGCASHRPVANTRGRPGRLVPGRRVGAERSRPVAAEQSRAADIS